MEVCLYLLQGQDAISMFVRGNVSKSIFLYAVINLQQRQSVHLDVFLGLFESKTSCRLK